MRPPWLSAIGVWGSGAALEEVFPQTHHQRCWVHKSANVLDNLPKTIQAQAKAHLHQMYFSPTRQDALDAYEDFLSLYDAKYPKACACLDKDKDVLFTFLRFPCRLLATPRVHQSHRIDIQHRSPPYTPDQRIRLTQRHDDDGLQIGRPSPKTLAQITRSQTR